MPHGTFLEELELDELMSYLGLFKSTVYVRSAPAERWNMPEEFDLITDEIVRRATTHKVISIKGESWALHITKSSG